MTTTDLSLQDQTRIAIARCQAAAAQARAKRISAANKVYLLMRSPLATWQEIAHWRAIESFQEDVEHAYRSTALYLTRTLRQPKPKKSSTG
jgi:hypothetical protein